MKSFLYQLIGIITCVSFVVACGDDDTDLSGLMLDKTDITVGAEGGTDRLLVQSSTEWVAAASEPWVMVSPANGVGTTECQVVIDSTLVNDVREATISFTPSGQLPQIVTIHQTGFEKVIKLEKTEFEIESSAKLDKRFFEVVVTTAKLFKSEKIDSLLTLVIPVITARSKYGFVLNIELNKLLVKDTNSSQYPCT